MVASSPFNANKRWIANKFVEMGQKDLALNISFEPLHFKLLDNALELYPTFQIYAAMCQYSLQCKENKSHYNAPRFFSWFYDNTPTPEMSKALCLLKHFPGNSNLMTAKRDIRTFEEAWFPTPEVRKQYLLANEVVEEYMRRL